MSMTKDELQADVYRLEADAAALRTELARVQADNFRYVECINKSESVAERINLVGELEALHARNEELLGIVMRCLGFWEAPNPTFGCGAKRQAELAKIKSDARAAIARAESAPTPAKHPDTVRLDWLASNKQSGGKAFCLQWTFRDNNNQTNIRDAIDAAIAKATGGAK